jgi:hypothetical protein
MLVAGERVILRDEQLARAQYEKRERIENSFASVPRNARGCGVFRVGERCFSL